MTPIRRRSVTEVGPGDFVKTLDGIWRPIVSNSAYGAAKRPRKWSITTLGGEVHDMWAILAYAKAEDLA